jgi:hypothetical protein
VPLLPEAEAEVIRPAEHSNAFFRKLDGGSRLHSAMTSVGKKVEICLLYA